MPCLVLHKIFTCHRIRLRGRLARVTAHMMAHLGVMEIRGFCISCDALQKWCQYPPFGQCLVPQAQNTTELSGDTLGHNFGS